MQQDESLKPIKECDYCRLKQIRKLAKSAGFELKLIRSRSGRFHAIVHGESVDHFKTILDDHCTCRK